LIDKTFEVEVIRFPDLHFSHYFQHDHFLWILPRDFRRFQAIRLISNFALQNANFISSISSAVLRRMISRKIMNFWVQI